MHIIESRISGMCFGVRDAISATRKITAPSEVTILGELVHNPLVNRELLVRGFEVTGEKSAALTIGGRPVVLITAHGVSEKRRAELAGAGKEVVDTTCPLVRRAHRAALLLAGSGYHVVVIGRRGHVEVEGLTGDLASFSVIEKVEDVGPMGFAKLGVMAQTTSVMREVGRILAAIGERNPGAEVRFIDTVCQPTKARQRALERLLGRVDVVVVVGGKHSNNTRQLVRACEEGGVRAVHVEGAGELRAEMFGRGIRVGLTAGTSTLGETLAAVRGELEMIARRVGTVREEAA